MFAVIFKFRDIVLSSFVGDLTPKIIPEFDQVDLLKVKHICKMLADLGVYNDTFLEPFLEKSEAFFKAKSQEKVNAKLGVPEYLQFSEGLIQIEGKLANFYLQPGTFLKVVELLESTLIASHNAYILGGLPALLDSP